MSESPDDAPHLSSSSPLSEPDRSLMGVRERHQEVVRLVERHVSLSEIATITSYSLRTVQHIVQRYRTLGCAVLRDGRTQAKGKTPLLTPSMQRELQDVLKLPPPNGGSWSGPKVAHWMAVRTGRPVARQRGWEYLHRHRIDNAVPSDPAECGSETNGRTERSR